MDEICWCGTIDEYDGSERHFGIDDGWRPCEVVVKNYAEQAKDDPLEWAPTHPDGTVQDLGAYIAELVRLLEATLRKVT